MVFRGTLRSREYGSRKTGKKRKRVWAGQDLEETRDTVQHFRSLFLKKRATFTERVGDKRDGQGG